MIYSVLKWGYYKMVEINPDELNKRILFHKRILERYIKERDQYNQAIQEKEQMIKGLNLIKEVQDGKSSRNIN